jgi:hypothetical protein
MEYDYDDYIKFADKVGWLERDGMWLDYSELTFSEKHYTGHLPVASNFGSIGVWGFGSKRRWRRYIFLSCGDL